MGKALADADMIGHKFNQLTVLREADRIRGRRAWRCRCDCGVTLDVLGNSLRTGNTKSCGCTRGLTCALRTHGHSKTREYALWKAAKQRCFDKNASNYKFYGAKGITMAPDWAEDFEAFLADMGPCPDGYTLEREDISRGYEPGNCRWATWEEQHRNHSRNVFVDMGGVQIILKDYAELRGVGYHGIQYRMKHLGEDAHQAATRLIENRRRRQSKARAA